MVEKRKDSLESLAEDLKAIGTNLRFNMSVQLLNTGLLLNKYIDMITREYGLNRGRLDIMHTLTIHDGILRPSELSKMLFRSKQTITQTIDGLEKDGLVERELMGKDRRTRRVIITEKGLSSIRASLPVTLEIANSATPQMSDEEIQTYTGFLRRARKHLVNQINNSRMGLSGTG